MTIMNRVVSAGQLRFDCCLYCGHNCCMQRGARTPNWPAQPATKPQAPVPGPPQAPITLKPDSSVERKKGGIGREC